MKKFTVLTLIFLCLIFNVIGSQSVFAVSNTFKEGVYKLSDFNVSKDNTFTFSNISKTGDIHFFVFDENEIIVHSIRLLPNSEKHITVPIGPDYRVVILGHGEVYMTPT